MSQEDLDRNVREGAKGDSWFDRLKVALGLKAPGSIRDDLEDALEEGEAGGDDDFTVEEKRILRNLLTARDIRIQDVMVPRSAIIAVPDDATLAELRALFASAAHSRLPVYTETLDDPRGMIHIRDMFARLDSIPLDARVREIGLVRPVLFAPGSKPALDLLLEMQSKRIHMALVIDEYGATDGLVSMEDLIEIIVGEIEDEHDIAEDSGVEPLEGGAIAINAYATLEEVTALLKVPFEPISDEHEIGTIGGYVTAFLGRVPVVGESVASDNGLIFTILDGDSRRIRRLRIAPAPEIADAAGE
ncbi:MAG: hemolysin family protein [Beijerinckiaceae bacterium]|nr:hemolysin family protein [Beijerinckiaceae bacterium]MCZ8300464.1 hemolysin family protein [Beijerinckiaceae bacterium]